MFTWSILLQFIYYHWKLIYFNGNITCGGVLALLSHYFQKAVYSSNAKLSAYHQYKQIRQPVSIFLPSLKSLLYCKTSFWSNQVWRRQTYIARHRCNSHEEMQLAPLLPDLQQSSLPPHVGCGWPWPEWNCQKSCALGHVMAELALLAQSMSYMYADAPPCHLTIYLYTGH